MVTCDQRGHEALNPTDHALAAIADGLIASRPTRQNKLQKNNHQADDQYFSISSVHTFITMLGRVVLLPMVSKSGRSREELMVTQAYFLPSRPR